MSDVEADIKRIIRALSSIRIPAVPEEYDIHAMIADALAGDGIEFAHEAKLAPRCRIDFLAGRIGIEVKKGKPARNQVLQQLSRYLESDLLDAILLVSEKEILLPAHVSGKRVYSVSLSRFWGIALP